jgi:tripartite-type tricarboxylate transporter receptor subunit TctC
MEMLLRTKTVCTTLIAAGAAFAFAIASAAAQPAEKFYEGKTIRIIVALGTGGDYDAYARLASRWLPRFIPGNPTIVVQNMPGAGGLLAANHLANVAPKDGTTIGALHANTTLAQATSAPNVEYDVRKFNWIGRTSSGGLNVHHTFVKSGVASFDDLLKRQVVVGAGGPTSDSTVIPTVINGMMGGKLKILGGYSGTAETTLALERGEVDMAMQNWEFLRRNNADWIRDKKINLIVQYATERHPELPNVPTIMELSKTNEQKQVWTLFMASGDIGYSLTMAADVPADRVALVRKAFNDMAKDAEFKADAAKINLPVDPLSGEQLVKVVDAVFKLEPAAIAKARTFLKR